MPLAPTTTITSPSQTLEAQARALIDVDRHADAIPLLLRALSSRPDDAMLLARIAYAHSHLGNDRETLQWADRAVAADPANEWAHRLRAHALWGRKKLKEALRAALEAARQSPEEPAVHRLLINLHLAMNRPKDAVAAAERLKSLEPDSAETHSILAKIALNGAQRNRNMRLHTAYLREAETHARAALAIRPDSPAILNQLAEAVTGLNRRDEATGILYASAQLNPADAATRKLFHQNVFTRFFMGWCALIGLFGIVVTALFFHFGVPLWPALLLGPAFCTAIAMPIFRRFGETLMARQHRFQALSAPIQATLRQLARDRRGALFSSFTTMSTVFGGVPALVLALTSMKDPMMYHDIVRGLFSLLR